MRYAHCRVVLTAAAHSETVGRPKRPRLRPPVEQPGEPPGFGL
jgi:hypothetical protein